MTLIQALMQARAALAADNIENPALESELLVRHALQIDRVRLYLDMDREMSHGRYKEFWNLVQRRLNNEPIAYIIGNREFYGLDFYVDSAVLITRPESELLVEKALELAQQRSLRSLADVGTGCGAIAISLALNLPQTRVYATDISPAALDVASYNCRKHGVSDRVKLLEGNLLEPLPEPVDLIVANLPYVREPELAGVNTLGFEPVVALNGGADGLDMIRRLSRQAAGKLRSGGDLLLEIGQGQGEMIYAYLREMFPAADIKLIPDLAGIERVVTVSLPVEGWQQA
jgi:release factor glutamine methyltransferase